MPFRGAKRSAKRRSWPRGRSTSASAFVVLDLGPGKLQSNRDVRAVVVVLLDDQSRAGRSFAVALDERNGNNNEQQCLSQSRNRTKQPARGSTNAQQPSERSSIVEIEDRVDERIERAVHVTEPRDEVDHPVRWTTSRTERYDHVHEEEW